jgi:hypothetical protein
MKGTEEREEKLLEVSQERESGAYDSWVEKQSK